MKKNSKELNYLGIAVTILVTAGFIWASGEWFNRFNWPRPVTSKEARSNEVNAYKNMKLIIEAQKKYREKDWDGDGNKTFAEYLVQLYRTITVDNDYIDLKFINKDLGFAMGQSKALKGYYFDPLTERAISENESRQLNYNNEWAIAGIPEYSSKTGTFMFITDQTNQIYVKQSKFPPAYYPNSPLGEGWTPIKSVKEFKKFQERSDL
jgi:hypothetical protein